jgi:hypothetical protein
VARLNGACFNDFAFNVQLLLQAMNMKQKFKSREMNPKERDKLQYEILGENDTVAHRISNSALVTKADFFHQFFCRCFFFTSSTTFFPPTLAPHHKRYTLSTTTMNDKRMVTLSFSPSRPSLPYHN